MAELHARDNEATAELDKLARRAGSALSQLCGIPSRSEAELLVEVGDRRRFTGEGASPASTAPTLPASSGEGDDEPKRHRLNRGGNRRVNAVLYRMAITQLRCDARAKKIFDDARARGHTKKAAIRVLKRHLSDVVYRRMMHDLGAREAENKYNSTKEENSISDRLPAAGSEPAQSHQTPSNSPLGIEASGRPLGTKPSAMRTITISCRTDGHDTDRRVADPPSTTPLAQDLYSSTKPARRAGAVVTAARAVMLFRRSRHGYGCECGDAAEKELRERVIGRGGTVEP